MKVLPWPKCIKRSPFTQRGLSKTQQTTFTPHRSLPNHYHHHKHKMSPTSTLPTVTRASSEVLAEAAKGTDSTFQLLYFPLHGRGELVRNLLAYSGAHWEELAVVSKKNC